MKTTTLFGILFLTASTACQNALAAPIGNTAVQSSADPRANAIIVPTQSQEDGEADLADLDDAASDLSDDDEDEDDEDEDDSETDDELDRRGAVRSMLPKAGSAALNSLKSNGKSRSLPHSKGSQQGSHKALSKSAGRSPSTRKVKPQILGGARGFRGAQTHARTQVGSKTGAVKKFRPALGSRGPLGGKIRALRGSRSAPLAGKLARTPRTSHMPMQRGGRVPLGGKTRALKGSRSKPLAGKLARIPRASRMPKQRGGSRASSTRSPSTNLARSGSLLQKSSDSRAKHIAGCKRSDVVCNMAGPSRTRPQHVALQMEPLGPGAAGATAKPADSHVGLLPASSSSASLQAQDAHTSPTPPQNAAGPAPPQEAHAEPKSRFPSLKLPSLKLPSLKLPSLKLPSWSSAKKDNNPILPLAHEMPQVPTGPVSEDDARRMTAHNDVINTRINLHNSNVQKDAADHLRRYHWSDIAVRTAQVGTGLAAVGIAGAALSHRLKGRSLHSEGLNDEKRVFTHAYYVADR